MTHYYTLQLHTGSFQTASYSFEEIQTKADLILSKIQVKDVILGWNTNKELNQKLLTYFHARKVRVLLWLPALSEIEQLVDRVPITTLHGATSEGINVIHEESFRFACPSNLLNVHHLIDIYERYFADLAFDGIFLDKIRFPSFANGYEEGFGCFCAHCEKAMIGLDLAYIKKSIVDHTINLIEGHYDEQGIYHFKDPMIHAFYKRRAHMISEYVFTLSTYFTSRKMIVGADLYAPFLAYHVGQNSKEISNMVDFIKPMFYRHTQAPAGMCYEYDAYQKHFSLPNSFQNIWKGNPASDQSIQIQLEFLSNLGATIYPGMEINPITNICDCDPKKVMHSLTLFKDYTNIALCWDFMQMSDDILNVLL